MTCELPSWSTESTKRCSGRAKKPFKCCECGGEIAVGAQYIEVAGKWSGDFEAFRFHMLCHGILTERDAYLRTECRLYEDEVPGFGELIDSSSEDARESGGTCAWWPKGMPITREALREAAQEPVARLPKQG